ncbi:MAG: AbrB family transcriptional regulator [Rhodoferax sp.]
MNKRPKWQRWAILLAASGVLGGALSAAQFPAAVLLGCMVAGIGVALRHGGLVLPRRLFGWGQGILGCLMAQSLHPEHLGPVLRNWPVFLLATVGLIAASAVLGWWLMRRRLMPGSTAVWGMAPGAASAMVIMADSYGADMRLVAFMQYTRVVVVTVLAALVAHLAGSPSVVQNSTNAAWLPQSPWALGTTLALVLGGVELARHSAMPGGAMVLPLLGSASLQAMGWATPELPQPLLLLAYAAIGWSVGLRFTQSILDHALRTLPQVLIAIAALIGVGLLMALVLVLFLHIDPLSAYLATSPGGADSMAVIAATSAVETSFVMAMQLARFLIVLVAGPWVTRWVATRPRAQPPA